MMNPSVLDGSEPIYRVMVEEPLLPFQGNLLVLVSDE